MFVHFFSLNLCNKNLILKLFITIFLILLNISTIFFSCKKKNEKLTISGTVYNTEINQPVSNVKVELYAKTITNGTWNTQFSLLYSQCSQNDGSFLFEFDNIRVSDFKLSFSKPGYFISEFIINPDLVQKGENYNQTYSVHYESWLKLLIKNFPPANSSDVLSYKLSKGSISCPDGCNDTLKYFFGSNIDTTSVCKIYGSQWAVLEWNVSSFSNHVQYVDSLWIPVSNTLVYNLYY